MTGDARAPQGPCHTRDTISKTHLMWHDMQWLSPRAALLGAFSTRTPFHHPIERWRFLPLVYGTRRVRLRVRSCVQCRKCD